MSPSLTSLDFDPLSVPPGHLDAAVLFQDRVWVDRHARVHAIDAMSPQYRDNVLSFLRTHAPSLQFRALCLSAASRGTGDDVEELHEVLALLDPAGEGGVCLEDPRQWLDNTPLAQRLLALSSAATAVV